MLQWMGGSRRKVSTSRKSTQKRQKQYFEQRKRQQQQVAELQTNPEGASRYGQHQKEHRSLDILSLQNVEADDRAMLYPAVKRKENLEKNPAEKKYDSTEGQPTTLINTVNPVDFVECKEAGPSSQYQMETESPKKILSGDPDYLISSSKGINDRLDCCGTASEQLFSVLDLLSYDEPNGMPEEIPGHEAHVAFSVEGLGKVETETPVHSPQQLVRIFSQGCSSSLNGARKPKSVKNLDNVLDELGVDIDIDLAFSGNSFDCSMNRMDSFNNLKDKLSTARSSEQYDGYGYRTKSSFRDNYNIANDDMDIWGASSTVLDDNILEEMEYDISRENWSCQMHGTSAGPLKYRDHEMLGHTFEGPLLKKRNAAKATDCFNISEPHIPFSEYQIAEDYDSCKASNIARHPNEGWKFDFEEVTNQPCWSYIEKEDTREDSLNLPSEESCSSSAVRGEAYYDLPSYSMSRDNRRHSNAFGSNGNKYSAKNMYAREMEVDQEDDVRQGYNVHRSGNDSGFPNPKSRPSNYSGFLFQEIKGPLKSWLFEEGFSSVNASSSFYSFSGTSEKKNRSSSSKHWNEDNLSVFHAPESQGKPVGKAKHGVPTKCSPSSSFLSEKCVFDQPFSHFQSSDSPVSLKVGPRKADLSQDCAMEGMPPDLSHIGGSFGKTPMESSLSKEECTSEFQPISCKKLEAGDDIFTWNISSSSENGRAMVASNSKENGSTCKEAKHESADIMKNIVATNFVDQEEETSSSVKIPVQFGRNLNEEEYQQDAIIPLQCQNPCKGEVKLALSILNADVEDAGIKERKIVCERHDTFADSPSQLLMLESFVLQLLCVQKIPKETSAESTLKKE